MSATQGWALPHLRALPPPHSPTATAAPTARRGEKSENDVLSRGEEPARSDTRGAQAADSAPSPEESGEAPRGGQGSEREDPAGTGRPRPPSPGVMLEEAGGVGEEAPPEGPPPLRRLAGRCHDGSGAAGSGSTAPSPTRQGTGREGGVTWGGSGGKPGRAEPWRFPQCCGISDSTQSGTREDRCPTTRTQWLRAVSHHSLSSSGSGPRPLGLSPPSPPAVPLS